MLRDAWMAWHGAALGSGQHVRSSGGWSQHQCEHERRVRRITSGPFARQGVQGVPCKRAVESEPEFIYQFLMTKPVRRHDTTAEDSPESDLALA